MKTVLLTLMLLTIGSVSFAQQTTHPIGRLPKICGVYNQAPAGYVDPNQGDDVVTIPSEYNSLYVTTTDGNKKVVEKVVLPVVGDEGNDELSLRSSILQLMEAGGSYCITGYRLNGTNNQFIIVEVSRTK